MKKINLLMTLLCLCSALPLAAQSSNAAPGRLDVAMTYQAARNDGSTQSFWLQGGSVQLEGRFWRGLGVVADVSGLHTANMHGSGVGLDMVTATFGPRYTLSLHQIAPHALARIDAKQRVSIYGEALGGVANGFNSVFPAAGAATDSANSAALQVGGGMNYTLTRRLTVRLFEANWLRTSLPNNGGNVQNNLKLGSGMVFSF